MYWSQPSWVGTLLLPFRGTFVISKDRDEFGEGVNEDGSEVNELGKEGCGEIRGSKRRVDEIASAGDK